MTHFLLHLTVDEEVESVARETNGRLSQGGAELQALGERARKAATLMTRSPTHSTQDNTSYHSDADTVATQDVASAWWGYIKECISVQSNQMG